MADLVRSTVSRGIGPRTLRFMTTNHLPDGRGAASTAFFVSPADDLVVIFLTQLRPSSSYPIRRELRAAVYASLDD
ncbi:hypothetical protein ACWCOV_24915 [Kribbella sp. NPDC002412]